MRTAALRSLSRAFAVLLVAIAFASCANRQDVLVSKLRGRGTARSYAIDVERAWTIARTLLKLEGTDRVEEHRSEGYLLTAQHAEGLNAGTYLGVFMEPEPPAATRVTVVTRRRSPVQAYPALTENAFHHKFAELVAMAAAVAPASTCAPRDEAKAPTDSRASERESQQGAMAPDADADASPPLPATAPATATPATPAGASPTSSQ